MNILRLISEHHTGKLQSSENRNSLPRCRQRGHGSLPVAVWAIGMLVGTLVTSDAASADDSVRLELTPSSAQLADCMPGATLDVRVKLATEKAGFDRFEIRAHDLPPERDFAVFLIELAGSPFGAAEYIGDFSTNKHGDAQNTYNLIVQEAFASTRVEGQRVRVDLNEVGVWFADPADDDFCLGNGGGPVTPFDGDNEAGAQVFNSANTDPLPAP